MGPLVSSPGGWAEGPLGYRPAMDDGDERDADIRARVREHWEASERGDVEAEHAIYATDAILDYPQSGERFTGDHL